MVANALMCSDSASVEALHAAHHTPWSQLSLNQRQDALTEQLRRRQWSAAGLILTRAFSLFERANALQKALSTFDERCAQRVVGARLLGQSLRDYRQEQWNVSPQASMGYFQALRPVLASGLAFHVLNWNLPSADLIRELTLIRAEGLPMEGESARQLALEAARLGRRDALDWLHQAGNAFAYSGPVERVLSEHRVHAA